MNLSSEHLSHCNQNESLLIGGDLIAKHEKRTLVVVFLTTAMMFIEIAAGYLTHSMALLADGWHMASHAGALTLAYVVYRLAKSRFFLPYLTFGSGKLLPLGGYTSAIGLGLIAIWMSAESIHRLLVPVTIEFNEAIVVAVVGLATNILSAFILGFEHNGQRHPGAVFDKGSAYQANPKHIHDHNHRSALVHVMADALTSVTAIIALAVGKYFRAYWLDPVMGIVGSIVILMWAYSLSKEAGRELLDGHVTAIDLREIRRLVQGSGSEVLDLHVWKVGPNNLACQLVVKAPQHKGTDHYRQVLSKHFTVGHLVVEERTY